MSVSTSAINSMLSSSNTTSLSRIISLRSIVTTSPVSSSTKSSVHFLKTLAASFLPIAAVRDCLSVVISSARSNKLRISLSESKPMARNKVVTGNFFFLSIYAYITELISVANSIQAPLKGMTLAENILVPFGWNV